MCAVAVIQAQEVARIRRRTKAKRLVGMKIRRIAVMPIITIYQGASGEGQEICGPTGSLFKLRCASWLTTARWSTTAT